MYIYAIKYKIVNYFFIIFVVLVSEQVKVWSTFWALKIYHALHRNVVTRTYFLFSCKICTENLKIASIYKANQCFRSPVYIFETQVPANVKRKSRSATNVCPSTGPGIDIVTNQEGPPAYKTTESTTSLKIKEQKLTVKYQKPSENVVKNKTSNAIDRSCTCCVRVNKTDAVTQYELSVETFVPASYDMSSEVCANTPQIQKISWLC